MARPNATVTQCAILAGGLGSRLGRLTANLPKPLLPCGDRPFVAWLMREFIRFGVTDFLLLTGHLSAEIERAAADIQASLPRPARITLSAEPIRAPAPAAHCSMLATGSMSGSCCATAIRCSTAIWPICWRMRRLIRPR